MLKFLITLVIGLCSLSLAQAEQPSSLEQKVVGTWQFTGRDRGRLVIRANHTCATMGPISGDHGWEAVAEGTWRIDGRYLIRVEKPVIDPSTPGYSRRPSLTSKLIIRSVTAESFALGAGPPLKRVK